MKINSLLIGFLIVLFTFSNVVAASSPYGNMDVYYNGKILPGQDTAKPLLKIGEPFNIGINLTVYQKCYVSLMLSEIGDNNFVILSGVNSKMKDYETEVMEKNSTKMYEWTVAATDNWAGGSLPINLVYQLNDFETGEILVNSKFTVAYCTISNEYYKGKVPSPSSSPSETLPSSNSTAPESVPAFTLLAAVFALTLASFRR